MAGASLADNRITRRSLLSGAASVVGWVAATSASAKSIAFIAGHTVTPPSNTVNFVTDFGADPTGIGVSNSAVAAFNTYFATATGDVTLIIPTGSYNITSSLTNQFARLNSTADSLTVSGYGATLLNNMSWGSNVTYDDNTHQARVQTVAAGSTTIQLVTLADHPLFNVGDWAVLTGLDLQAGGSPPSAQWHEYVQIIAKDTGTGVCILTLSDPLDNAYKSTWPHYNSGGAFTPDEGGPATLYAINQTWDLDIFIQGMTFNGTGNQEYCKFRHVEYLDCTWGVVPGPTPTANLYYKWENCSIASSGLEPDKLVTTLEVVNTTILGMTFQSASVRDTIIDGCTISSLSGNGGGDTTISNTTITNWVLAPTSYGACLGTHAFTNVTLSGSITNAQGGSVSFPTSNYTHVGGGVFSYAKAAHIPQAWGVPGARVMVTGSNGTITQFTVMDVYDDATNTYYVTDLGGAFPTAPSGWGATVSVTARATNYITASGMVGNVQITNMNNVGAQGLPLNSYFKATYSNSFSPAASALCNGKLVSFSINVTLAYAGATSTVKVTPAQFHTFGTLDSTYAAYDFTPSINAKIAGARVFRPGGVTGSQTGDTSMTAPPSAAPWMSSGIAPFLSASVADGTLTVVFEVIYDQEAIPINATVQDTSWFAATTYALDGKDYYTPGNESPAVSTADYYHMHACQFMRAYDLDAMGASGATVKAANGNNRYVWIMSAEHPEGGAEIHRDCAGFKVGFSNDPGIPPPYVLDFLPSNNQFVGSASLPGTNGFTMTSDMAPSAMVYNPDDVSFPFYLYTQGRPASNVIGTQSVVWKSSDMLHWEGAAWNPKDFIPNVPANIPNSTNLSSYQAVTRLSTGVWQSFGDVGDLARMGYGTFTGTNGLDFTYPSSIYNISGYPTVALTLSGTTLTAGSAIFAASDVDKGVTIVYNGGASALALANHTPTRIATYVSPTQVTLNQNVPAATLSANTFPFQFGVVSIMTAPAIFPVGGISQFWPSSIGPEVRIGWQNYRLFNENAVHDFQPTDDGYHATLAPLDSANNIIQSVPIKRIANYTGIYAGPGYEIHSIGTPEDGLLHVYAELGYPGPHGTSPMPYVSAACVGSLSGTTLTLTSVSGYVTIGALVYVAAGYVGQITAGTPGGTGTYTVENDSGKSASAGSVVSINAGNNYNVGDGSPGGFRQQHVQYLTCVTNDWDAAQAAPFGVTATCSSNTVTIAWKLQTLRSGSPAQTYNVYRGTTAGTQATLLGNTATASMTDTPTPGSVYYYRVVKVSGGIEQTTKYRIVHTYVG